MNDARAEARERRESPALPGIIAAFINAGAV